MAEYNDDEELRFAGFSPSSVEHHAKIIVKQVRGNQSFYIQKRVPVDDKDAFADQEVLSRISVTRVTQLLRKH